MVEKDLIREKIKYIEQNLRKLQNLADLSGETFRKKFYYVESAKHLLQVSIEAMLDISQHIIARQRYRAPKNYADVFVILVEEGVLPEDKKDTFIQMARFRNRVVHLYHQVDEDELYEILQEGLGDFQEFIKSIVGKFF